MGRHRADPVRPRYGRISVLATSLVVTSVAVLGGTGVLPATLTAAGSTSLEVARDPAGSGGWLGSALTIDLGAAAAAASSLTAATAPAPPAPPAPPAATGTAPDPSAGTAGGTAADTALPVASGEGRRVVYSESRQRVWLVEEAGVSRTYLVSGSVYDNLEPGTYEVYSRSEDAVGIDDSGTMKYFVRFTQGDTGAAIGFHDIPVDDGKRVQTFAQLGTPQSHGCIRQRRSDAIDLWEFAPLGTTVVVTA